MRRLDICNELEGQTEEEGPKNDVCRLELYVYYYLYIYSVFVLRSHGGSCEATKASNKHTPCIKF